MKKSLPYILFVLEIIISASILYTSTFSNQSNVINGGRFASFLNNVFFHGELNEFELKNMVGFGAKFIGHFLFFALDGLIALFLWKYKKNNKATLILLIYALFLSSLGEIIQIFSSLRTPSIFDVLIDFSGYCLPLFCYLISKRRPLFVFNK